MDVQALTRYSMSMNNDIRFTVAPEGSKIVAETTPNPEWDRFGHIFLTLEEVGDAMTLSEIVDFICEYNEDQEATVPAAPADVLEGLAWLLHQGMIRTDR